MKANSDKSRLLLGIDSDVVVTANINGNIISNSKSKDLLGITIDYKLTFGGHVSRICDKASKKYSALVGISSFMKPVQERQIMKPFIGSQFGYCPVVWFFLQQTLKCPY